MLVKEIKELYPEKDIWLYTGYDFDQIKDLQLMKYIDVLIDGKFIEERRDITLAFRGSANQKIIDVKQSLKNVEIIELEM